MWQQTKAEGAQSTRWSSLGWGRIFAAKEGGCKVSDNNQDFTHEIATGGLCLLSTCKGFDPVTFADISKYQFLRRTSRIKRSNFYYGQWV